MKFKLKSPFKPTGDQPQAIEKLTKNIVDGSRYQVLLGVTGSGKTFTIANVIANINRPTLVISHNKTLAAQLYQEFRDFFPKNAVSYFVSYYDYYQPEAYIPQTDTYIEKEVEINEEIDKLRLSATTNLLTRSDTIVVASVSCIYNLGSPVEYGKFVLELRVGMKSSTKAVLYRLTDLQYERNEYSFLRGTFRVRGDRIDIFPSYMDIGISITFRNDYIENLNEFDPLTGDELKSINKTIIYPAKHYMTNPKSYDSVFKMIRKDLNERVKELRSHDKLLEVKRLEQKVNFDLEMIREVGYVNGIENYSRYFDGRKPGEPPYTLLDYFNHTSSNFVLVIDESHITLPQLRGMYNGDRARKEVLIEHGFRLPSALDNRPLRYEEFMRRTHQTIYVSATPNDYEFSLASQSSTYEVKRTGPRRSESAVVEQLIRPTGIVDPQIKVKPTQGQINDLIGEIEKMTKKKLRTLVTTLTKRMAEELSFFFEEKGIKVAYLHSDIETLERQDILDRLRFGQYDVLVGINLLREGLDLPEVSLVAILDADKEGFLRSKTSLIQVMGRAARHTKSKVIMYADFVTKSMQEAINEVRRRRNVQLAYNKAHGIKPTDVQKSIRLKLVERQDEQKNENFLLELEKKKILLPDEREAVIKKLRKDMMQAAKDLDFETATVIRDRIRVLKNL